ncbi:Molecular chaperone (DnaJ superfamily) [Elasticomyces elasticus]|nr:Molecular chaperone (DnaJ superfamily) [Elasticomyces elasticus]
MPVDDILYRTLGVLPNSTPGTIRTAWRRCAIQCHPDKTAKDRQSQADAVRNFVLLNEAYEVLSDDVKRIRYDKHGFEAVLGRRPEAPASTNVAQAKTNFSKFATSEDNGVEDEVDLIEELLTWWTQPEITQKVPEESLRMKNSSFYEQLVALYDQFRLTHSDTTEGDKRSAHASEAILQVAEACFGTFHAKRLRSWAAGDMIDGESPDLHPSVDDQNYIDGDGREIPIPRETSIARLPDGIQMIHLSWTETFVKFVNTAPGRQKVVLRKLTQYHGIQYREFWKKLKATNSHDPALASFKQTINWPEIANTLKEIREAGGPQEVTKFKLAQDRWKTLMREHGLPYTWHLEVHRKLIKPSAPNYHASKWSNAQATAETGTEEDAPRMPSASLDTAGPSRQASSPDNSNTGATDVTMDDASSTSGENLDPTDDNVSVKSQDTHMTDATAGSERGRVTDPPDSSIWVRDGDARREVFAFRQTVPGRSSQLLLRMTTPEATFALFDIVSAKMFNRTVELIKTQPARDFGKMEGNKDDLRNKDYADLTWVGIATQRRGIMPDDGWLTQPPTYMLSQNRDGTVRAFTRSDVGAVFGKASIDVEIHNRRLAAGGQKALPAPPARRQIAWSAGTDAEDDLATFTTTHPQHTKLLQHEAQQEQYEREIISNLVRALGKGTRVPGIDKATERQEPQRQEHNEAMSNVVRALGKGTHGSGIDKAREREELQRQEHDEALRYLENLSLATQSGSSKKQGKQREGRAAAVPPPKNADEALALLAACKQFARGEINATKYGQ